MTEQEPVLLKAARVWSETGNYDKVAEATGLSKVKAKEAVEMGVKALLRMKLPNNPNPDPSNNSKHRPDPSVPNIEAQEAASPEAQTLFEKELLLQAMPIMRKVALNPKVYLYYDYAVKTLGFKGDIGDMLVDTVEDFFKSRGYSIKIIKEDVVE